MCDLASNFNDLRERCAKRQFQVVTSGSCGKESGRTLGCARIDQLATELVEVLPETSAGGDHDAIEREGGSLFKGRCDVVVVVELRQRDELCRNPGHEERLVDDCEPC